MLHRIPGSIKKMGSGSSSVTSAWSNTRLAKTSAYTVLTADAGSTIALGGSGFFTLTFNAASGYSATFAAMVINEDTGRGKVIAPNGLTSFILWPGQSFLIFNDNSVWKIHPPTQRWKLTGAVTLNVDNSLGNDANDGLATGSGNAFLTIQGAFNCAQANFDLGTNVVTIQTTNATYTAGVIVTPWIGSTSIILNLGGGTLNPTAPASGAAVAVQGSLPAPFQVANGTLKTTTSGTCLHATQGAVIVLGAGITFGACAGVHVQSDFLGNVQMNVSYAINGNPTVAHVDCLAQGQVAIVGGTVTFTGSINFGIFALCSALGLIYAGGGTFTGGTLTGTKFNVSAGGAIITNGGGINYFPGPTAGTSTGGTYV